jgi:uncharacterized protein
MNNSRAVIQKILAEAKTIAVVGFSSDPSRAGCFVPKYLQEHGYRIIPVNPYIEAGLGQKAYPDLPAVPEPVDLVLVFRRSEAVPPIVEAAIRIGARSVWLQSGIINAAAAAAAQEAGLDFVMDACMMVEHRYRS